MTSVNAKQLAQHSPIIIIGMHRSGTSMITRILEELGLFVGDEKQADHESIFFLNLNDKFLSTIGQHWDYIENVPIDWTLDQQRSLADIAYEKLNSRLLTHYHRSLDSINSLDLPWGWKDPRNTLTFDIWQYLFPHAKVIHIYRNPIDVAVSLRSRYVKSKGIGNFLKRMKVKLPRFLKRLSWESRIKHERNPAALLDLNCGIELSKKYLEAAANIMKTVPANRYYDLCYENFLDNPTTFINELVEFTGLTPTKGEIQQSLVKLDRSRKFAFANDEGLRSVYNELKNEPWMKEWGYDKIV